MYTADFDPHFTREHPHIHTSAFYPRPADSFGHVMERTGGEGKIASWLLGDEHPCVVCITAEANTILELPATAYLLPPVCMAVVRFILRLRAPARGLYGPHHHHRS